jgi:phage terminase small subunit
MELGLTMRHTYETFDTPEFSGTATPRRLKPSARLKGRQRAIFIETVNDCVLGHFKPSDRPILEAFCRAAALVEQAGEKLAARSPVLKGKTSPWVGIFVSATKTMNALALRLRISPQSRTSRAPKTQAAPMSFYDTMELTEEDDDHDDGAGADGGRH